MSKPKEFKDKKWNAEKFKAVGTIARLETKKRAGNNFLNSVEQMGELWRSDGRYKKNIISKCEEMGLGSVENVLAYVFNGQSKKDIVVSKTKKPIVREEEVNGKKKNVTYYALGSYSGLEYKSIFEFVFEDMGMTLYSPKKSCKLFN